MKFPSSPAPISATGAMNCWQQNCRRATGPPRHFSTSGSSGIPIAMEITRFWGQANRAAIRRFHKLHGIVPTKSSASFSSSPKSDELRTSDYVSKAKEGPVLRRGHRSDGSLFSVAAWPKAANWTSWRRKASHYIFDIPNNVEVLAIANLSRKNPVRLEALVFHGQGVTLEQRNLFRKSFGARSLSIYSSEEGGLMGYQCADNQHFHLNSEMVFLGNSKPRRRDVRAWRTGPRHRHALLQHGAAACSLRTGRHARNSSPSAPAAARFHHREHLWPARPVHAVS